MQILLIMRCQIICICFLLVFLIYTTLSSRINTRKEFQKICITALLQVTFDAITIYLVNVVYDRPELRLFNRIAHVFVVGFAVLFCFYFFGYVVKLIYPANSVKKIMFFAKIPFYLYIFASPFKDFDYVKGRGTNYVGGPYVEFWFFIGMLYVIASMILIYINRKKIERSTVITLETITSLMIVDIIFQIKIPELLLTGGSIALITVAVYLTLENTTENTKNRVMIDIETGVKNKQAFKVDMEKYNDKYFKTNSQYERIGLVMCDISNLSVINDTYGLIEGDELIAKTADILSKSLLSANGIYRIRGDVFLAIYTGVDKKDIVNETLSVKKEVKKYGKELEYNYVIGIAEGCYDNTDEDSMEDILNKTEKEMLHQKEILKKKLSTKQTSEENETE